MFRICSMFLAISISCGAAVAQTSVTLKVAKVSTKSGEATLTLASGRTITVPIADTDLSPAAPTTSGAVPEDAIRATCSRMFKDNFQMQAFCLTQQRESYASMQKRPMTTTDQQTIRRKCREMFPDNFQMENFCEEQQLKSLAELGR